jgi:hypothetical protein
MAKCKMQAENKLSFHDKFIKYLPNLDGKTPVETQRCGKFDSFKINLQGVGWGMD